MSVSDYSSTDYLSTFDAAQAFASDDFVPASGDKQLPRRDSDASSSDVGDVSPHATSANAFHSIVPASGGIQSNMRDLDSSSSGVGDVTSPATSANATYTPFWTATKQMSLAEHLSSRFQCPFEELEWVQGMMVVCPKGNSETKVRFYASTSFMIKAYMNVTRSNNRYLGQSLHEAAATAFACREKGWKCEVFGVRTEESTHICLLRARLNSQTSTADEAADACVDLLVTTGVAHGDPHPGNVFQGASGVEVLDFERSFLIEKNLHSDMTRSIQTFANDPESRNNLLQEFRNQGLEDTRHRFIRLAEQILNGKLDISTLGISELLRIFQNKK